MPPNQPNESHQIGIGKMRPSVVRGQKTSFRRGHDVEAKPVPHRNKQSLAARRFCHSEHAGWLAQRPYAPLSRLLCWPSFFRRQLIVPNQLADHRCFQKLKPTLRLAPPETACGLPCGPIQVVFRKYRLGVGYSPKLSQVRQSTTLQEQWIVRPGYSSCQSHSLQLGARTAGANRALIPKTS